MNCQIQTAVPPTVIRIIDTATAANTAIANGTTLGPMREGHRLTVVCEVLDTRPAPLVGWYRAGKLVGATLSTAESTAGEGLFNVRSALDVQLTRLELAATYECRVETPALPHVVRQQLHLDLQVRPTKIQMTGLSPITVQGTIVQVICLVSGARPAANITWYNNTTPLDAGQRLSGVAAPHRSISTKQEVRNDGTFATLSKMVFTASRYENGMTVRCEGENVVMRSEETKSLKQSFRMEVSCKCCRTRCASASGRLYGL